MSAGTGRDPRDPFIALASVVANTFVQDALPEPDGMGGLFRHEARTQKLGPGRTRCDVESRICFDV